MIDTSYAAHLLERRRVADLDRTNDRRRRLGERERVGAASDATSRTRGRGLVGVLRRRRSRSASLG